MWVRLQVDYNYDCGECPREEGDGRFDDTDVADTETGCLELARSGRRGLVLF